MSQAISPRRFISAGLGIHAVLISVGLIALIAVLGGRAYEIGRAHFIESRELLERDMPAEKLIFQIESAQSALVQAKKKLQITSDPAYSALVTRSKNILGLRKRELWALRPEMGRSADLKGVEEKIANEREQTVRHARDSAQGLVRLIGLALALSLLITAWLMLLLYKGLMDPLKTLNQATKKIRAGELSARIDERGVAELRDLSRSFNSMALRLESLDRAKSEFLALISHELRNPMAALKEGLALLSYDMAGDKVLTDESKKRCISACAIASKRLEHMINNLLSLSRSEPGAFHFEMSKNNLVSVIQSSVAEVRPIAEKKGMQISVRCPSELIFSFNREGMVQAFVNLLLNSIKYGADGSVIDVLVEIGSKDPLSKTESEMINVTISNAGKEIAPQELNRIFDAFYRGENSSKQQGMGIGLHVVKRVVEAHRGFVSALSDAGRTRMIITLPLLILAGCSAPTKPAPMVPTHDDARTTASTREVEFHAPPGPLTNSQITKTVKQVERKIRRSKGEQVLISKSLLERLLHQEEESQLTCDRVSGQLEALKKVDVDGLHSLDR